MSFLVSHIYGIKFHNIFYTSGLELLPGHRVANSYHTQKQRDQRQQCDITLNLAISLLLGIDSPSVPIRG